MANDLIQRLKEDWEMLKDGYQPNLTKTWHNHAMGAAALDCEEAAQVIEGMTDALVMVSAYLYVTAPESNERQIVDKALAWRDE